MFLLIFILRCLKGYMQKQCYDFLNKDFCFHGRNCRIYLSSQTSSAQPTISWFLSLLCLGNNINNDIIKSSSMAHRTV